MMTYPRKLQSSRRCWKVVASWSKAGAYQTQRKINFFYPVVSKIQQSSPEKQIKGMPSIASHLSSPVERVLPPLFPVACKGHADTECFHLGGTVFSTVCLPSAHLQTHIDECTTCRSIGACVTLPRCKQRKNERRNTKTKTGRGCDCNQTVRGREEKQRYCTG